MGKKRIDISNYSRCLLTEVIPYETPILFSNWGSYNFVKNLKKESAPSFLKFLFQKNYRSIPYKYSILHKPESKRTLSLVHPNGSEKVVDLYERFEILITKKCSKSEFSIRYPDKIAKFFTVGSDGGLDLDYLEKLEPDDVYGSSFFSYNKYSHLYKFFDSDQFTELEKEFLKLQYLDVANCFSSIYTHSLSWALRGKLISKNNIRKSKKGFDSTFDSLMQYLNYQETNGIVIGPELSRIFAEIIFQEIDQKVYKALISKGLEHGKDYWCCRFIDDYFIFFNDEKIKDTVVEGISNELEIYKLYLNSGKSEVSERPFITDISISKINLSNYLNGLDERLDKKKIDAYKELNRIRAIIRESNSKVEPLVSFFIKALNNKFRDLDFNNSDLFVDKILLYLELTFHMFRMSIRMNNTFRLISFVLEILRVSNKLNKHQRVRIQDKIYFEFLNAIEYGLREGGGIECVNLLIPIAELGKSYKLPANLLETLISKCREEHKAEYSKSRRLSYIEIVCILYYIRNNDRYLDLKSIVLIEAQRIISKHDPKEYAESFYLLFDLVSCPSVDDDVKNNLVVCAMLHEKPNDLPSKQKVGRFRNYVGERDWYFNWNKQDELENLVIKKNFHQSYS